MGISLSAKNAKRREEKQTDSGRLLQRMNPCDGALEFEVFLRASSRSSRIAFGVFK
jgi:hypothetical protein